MVRFKQVTPRVLVTDLRRTITFYKNSLGFQVDVLWPEKKPMFCILTRDEVSLGFFEADEHRKGGSPGSSELHIEIEDVADLHQSIKDRVTIEWGPEVYFYGRREFAVRDPDGYLVIFSEPTDDPPTSPEQ